MVAKIEHKNRTGCPVACSLDIIGDHWSLLVIRSLMFKGVHEYKDMLKEEEQISTSILTNRLKKLETEGLISAMTHPESKRRKLYYLTEMGKDLLPMMTEMVLWASKNLSELLAIPEDLKALLNNDPEQFIQLTLQTIEDWEEQYLN